MLSRLARVSIKTAILLTFVIQQVGMRAQAQTTQTQTNSAYVYLQLELDVQEALKGDTSQKMKRLLSGDFRFHSPSQPNLNPQEWFDAKSLEAHQEWQIRDVEVESFGHIRIVSFTRLNVTSNEQHFVVDVWNDARKKLISRYEASLSSSNIPVDSVFPAKNQPRPNGRG